MSVLYVVLGLSVFGLVLVAILFKTSKPLLELVLSLQKRITHLENQPSFYSQTVVGLNRRVEYLQKKCDEQEHELRYLRTDRASLDSRAKILEEQNKVLTESLKALHRNQS